MRVLHRLLTLRLGRIVRKNADLLKRSYGALSRKSNVLNAAAHARSQYFYQIDISDAYASTPLSRLAEVLFSLDPTLGELPEVESFLHRYCGGENGGLAVGAPASPALFDLYCATTLDCEMPEFDAATLYTRYHDDITLSSTRPIPSIVQRRVRERVSAAGFVVNRKKSRVTDLQKRAVTITGAVITRQGTLRPTDAFLKKVRLALRRPVTEITGAEALVFAGTAGYLRCFEERFGHRYWMRADTAPEIEVLIARVRKRLRELASRNLLPSKRSRDGANFFSIAFIEELRRTMTTEELIGMYLALKPVGREFVGLSPFSRERHPSFTVATAPHKLFWHDFSSGKHGDVFDFLMEMEGMSFRDAVREVVRLCVITGRTLPSS